MDNGIMENFFGRLKVEMYYGEKFESPREFIEKLEEYIYYYNNERISLKTKRNEPSGGPSSFANDLIFNFCLNFWVHFNMSLQLFTTFYRFLGHSGTIRAPQYSFLMNKLNRAKHRGHHKLGPQEHHSQKASTTKTK